MLNKLVTTLIFAIAFAAALPVRAATPANTNPFDTAYTPLTKLPPQEQRQILLIALGDVAQNNDSLERETPEQRTDILKIVATQYTLGRKLAAAIGWDDLASTLERGSSILQRIIRGELEYAAAGHTLDDWRSNYGALRLSAERKFKQSGLGIPTTANANDARHAIATYINAVSRILVWGQRPHETPTSPSTRRAIAKDAQTYRVKMLQAADALAHLPKSERIVALLDAGGSVNTFVKSTGERARDQSDNKKRAALLTGATALDQLAALAKTLGFNDAAQCHAVEATHLRAMAKGTFIVPTGCRAKAYPAALRNAAVRTAQGPRGQTIDDMTQKWINAARFFSDMSNPPDDEDDDA